MRRLLATLLIALTALPVAAQKPAGFTFRQLRERIEAERDQPAAKRIRTIALLARFKIPQGRRLLLELYEGEQNASVQNAILRLLGTHENAEVLALLSEQLQAGRRESIQRTAAHGLLNQERAGLQALAKALSAPRVATRGAALSALGAAAYRRDDARRVLVEALPRLSGKEQHRALVALRRAPKNGAFAKQLIRLVESPHPATRAEAIRQLALAGHAGVKRQVLRDARDDELLKKNEMRGAVFFALAAIADADTLPVLLELAMEGGPLIVHELAAIAKLEKTRDNLVRGLAAVLQKSEKAIERLVAVELLVRFKTKEATRALIRALGDASTAVVLAAMPAIKRRRPAGARAPLKKLFAGNHPELRLEAMLAIHELRRKDPGWPTQLIQQLDSEKIGLKCKAIDLLRDLRHKRALAPVQALIGAPQWQVRSAVYSFLKVVRDKSSIPLLIEAMDKEESGRLEYECLFALIALTHKNLHRVAYWKKWWAAVGDDFVLPKEPKTKAEKDKAARARPAAVTYYSIPVTSKRTAFLIDVSGSMNQPAGTSRYRKIKSAKTALIQILKNFEADQRFNLIAFEGRVRAWSDKLREMNEPSRLEAIAYTRSLTARGGTNIHGALQSAFDDMSVDTVYLLSDGQPSAGDVVDVQELADTVARWNRDRRIIIHTISFGRDSPLLQRLAAESGGRYVRYV